MISYADFEKIAIRVGTVVEAEPFPEARKPAIKLWLDFGELGILKSSAQITARYQPQDLVGRQLVAVTNFPSLKVAGFVSEVLVLGAVQQDGSVVLLRPDVPVSEGSKVL